MASSKKKPASVSQPPAPAAIADVPLKAPRGSSLLLQVGLITLPVKLSTGARAETVSFKKLHASCLSPTKTSETQGQVWCPVCSEYVPADEVAKGYEVSKGTYVTLTAEEIEAAKPDTDKLVEIDQFVPAESIDPIYYQSSYYLSPDEGGNRAFVLVREMLRRSGKVAMGKATLHGNEHTVILRPFGKGLMLHQMFHVTELNMIPFGVDGVEVSDKEMELAGKLVEQMSGTFQPERFSDRYLANIRELVASKQAGQAPALPERKKRAVAVDLMAALSQSLEVVKRKVA
jgi:DNA end-binding protein Ku